MKKHYIYIQGGSKVGLQLDIQCKVFTVAVLLVHPIYI